MPCFDYIHNTFELGAEFRGMCETYDLGGLYSTYWLDPAGRLWHIDTTGTTTTYIKTEGDPGYSAKQPWKNLEHLRNGHHGKVTPACVNGYVELFPPHRLDECNWSIPRLHFVDGVVTDHKV